MTDQQDKNGQRPWPTEIRYVSADKRLDVEYDDGTRINLSAEFLRVNSPSAEVKGHGPGQEILVTGVKDVGINRMDPVGNYALRIHFDDGHETGIYSWAYLYELAADHDRLWADHLKKLDEAGATR